MTDLLDSDADIDVDGAEPCDAVLALADDRCFSLPHRVVCGMTFDRPPSAAALCSGGESDAVQPPVSAADCAQSPPAVALDSVHALIDVDGAQPEGHPTEDLATDMIKRAAKSPPPYLSPSVPSGLPMGRTHCMFLVNVAAAPPNWDLCVDAHGTWLVQEQRNWDNGDWRFQLLALRNSQIGSFTKLVFIGNWCIGARYDEVCFALISYYRPNGDGLHLQQFPAMRPQQQGHMSSCVLSSTAGVMSCGQKHRKSSKWRCPAPVNHIRLAPAENEMKLRRYASVRCSRRFSNGRDSAGTRGAVLVPKMDKRERELLKLQLFRAFRQRADGRVSDQQLWSVASQWACPRAVRLSRVSARAASRITGIAPATLRRLVETTVERCGMDAEVNGPGCGNMEALTAAVTAVQWANDAVGDMSTECAAESRHCYAWLGNGRRRADAHWLALARRLDRLSARLHSVAALGAAATGDLLAAARGVCAAPADDQGGGQHDVVVSNGLDPACREDFCASPEIPISTCVDAVAQASVVQFATLSPTSPLAVNVTDDCCGSQSETGAAVEADSDAAAATHLLRSGNRFRQMFKLPSTMRVVRNLTTQRAGCAFAIETDYSRPRFIWAVQNGRQGDLFKRLKCTCKSVTFYALDRTGEVYCDRAGNPHSSACKWFSLEQLAQRELDMFRNALVASGHDAQRAHKVAMAPKMVEKVARQFGIEPSALLSLASESMCTDRRARSRVNYTRTRRDENLAAGSLECVARASQKLSRWIDTK